MPRTQEWVLFSQDVGGSSGFWITGFIELKQRKGLFIDEDGEREGKPRMEGGFLTLSVLRCDICHSVRYSKMHLQRIYSLLCLLPILHIRYY